MKKINYVIYLFIFLIIIVFVYLLFSKQEVEDVKEEKIVLQNSSITLLVDEEKSLGVSVTNVVNPKLQYISLDNNIASVSNRGIVKGIKEGDTVIYISYVDSHGNNFTEKCNVIVLQDETKIIEKVSFPGDNLIIQKGNNYKLDYVLEPNNIPSSVSFLSFNNNIVSVDSDGNIVALEEGMATIKVIVNNNIEDEVNVYVKDKMVNTNYITLPTSVLFDEKDISMTVDDEQELKYTVSPSNASKDIIDIKSTDENVVKYEDGKIKAVGVGNAVLIVESVNKALDIISVSVKSRDVKVDSITLTSSNTISMYTSETSQITYQIMPLNATNQSVIYTGYDPAIISVSDTGLVKGLTRGNTTITVITLDGSKQVTIDVKINSKTYEEWQGVGTSCNNPDPADAEFNKCFSSQRHLSLSKTSVSIPAGGSATIQVTLPSACGTLVNWTRKTADGEDGWEKYVSQSRSNITSNGFTWIITAKASAKGKTVHVSQTVQYDSLSPSGKCTGNVKSMGGVDVTIT